MNKAKTSIGTPFYMAPELFQAQPYTNAVDIFALGCMIHEMATLYRTYDASTPIQASILVTWFTLPC